MQQQKWTSHSLEQTHAIAGEILVFCKNRKIFAIFGELGAGKTAFVKAACDWLQVVDAVKSPTFALVNEYHGARGRVFHFDFYRIRRPEEAWDIGLEEYLDSGDWCFIEWPEKIEGLVPEEAVRLKISATAEGARIFEVEFE